MKNLRCNEQIRLSPIRLIDENGQQAGIVPTDEALSRARDLGLDLVEVSPTDRPPVCKIMDYGKFKYSQSKQKQKHHEQRLKELRMRPRTDPHDREIKVQRARQFLEHGDRVQFTMMFRGRERFHQNMGEAAFLDIMKELEDLAKVERSPKMEGRRLTMVLVPLKPGGAKKAAPSAAKKPKAAGPSEPADAKATPAPATSPAGTPGATGGPIASAAAPAS